jgi:hypothetical protein
LLTILLEFATDRNLDDILHIADAHCEPSRRFAVHLKLDVWLPEDTIGHGRLGRTIRRSQSAPAERLGHNAAALKKCQD